MSGHLQDTKIAEVLTPGELTTLRAVAVVLLPGNETSPAATSLPDIDALLNRAAEALGPEAAELKQTLAALPAEITWDGLKALFETDADAFDLISTTAAGAYFMSPSVLEALGYPTGPRKAARIDQAANELESGILDPVMERDSMVRWPADSKVL